MRCTKFYFQPEVVRNQNLQLLCYVIFFDILHHYGVIAASQICSVEKVLCRLTEQIFIYIFLFSPCSFICFFSLQVVMDDPGESLYMGGSVQMDSIRPTDPDDDKEDEEERRERDERIDGMLANAFDDLEDESFATQGGLHSVASNGAPGREIRQPYSNRQSTYPEEFSSVYTGNIDASEFQQGGNYVRPSDQDEDEDDEEEKRQREEDIDGMLANAFSDLEEEESFATSADLHSVASNQVLGYENELPCQGPEAADPREGIGIYAGNIDIRGCQYDGNPLADVGNHPMNGQLEDLQDSSSHSQTPWSDESDSQSASFNPNAYHRTARVEFQHANQEMLAGSEKHAFHVPSDDLEMNAHTNQNTYSPENYQSGVNLDRGNFNVKPSDYRAADGSHEQLRLLYEARGRELDNLTAELSKVRSDNLREVRALQHQIGLLTSDNESQKSNLNQYQILLSENEELVKKLKVEVADSQKKTRELEDENKRIKSELEVSKSVVATLECQISELKAVDSLARNQKLNENFVKKLRQGNQDAKDLLMSKIRDLQNDADAYQDENKKLREELKSLRKNHDDLLVQKTEMATKLTVTVETLKKQYDDLLQSQSSQKNLELQLRNRSLESDKDQMSEKLLSMQDEITKLKEEIKGYDSALAFGILGDAMSGGEDTIAQLGIKRALSYDESVAENESKKGMKEPMSEKQMILKLKGELKSSLMANKMKREEIAQLQKDTQEKQNQLRKLQSDLKSSQANVTELKENIFRLKMEQSESQALVRMKDSDDTDNLKSIQVENISLKQELACLYDMLRNMDETLQCLSNFLVNSKEKTSESPVQVKDELLSLCNKLLQTSEQYSEVIAGLDRHREVISTLREKTRKLQEEAEVWEKRIHSIEVKLVASLNMIETALTDENNVSELTHAQGVLHKLFGEIQEQIRILKENAEVTQKGNMYLEDQLRTTELELEKQRNEATRLTKEKEALQSEMVLLGKKKDEEKALALRSCQDSYLKFHEDVVKELHMKFNAEYESIGTKLKSEISRLVEELTKVKTLYVCVCEEKNELEDRLKKSHADTSYSAHKEIRSLSFTQTAESVEKKVLELTSELSDLRKRHKEDKEQFVTEKEELERKCEIQSEACDELSKKVKMLQEKCSSLEYCKRGLEEKLQGAKGGKFTSEINGSITEEFLARGHEKCEELLKAKRLECKAIENELKTKFENELSDLNEKLIQVDKQRAKEALAAKALEESLQRCEKEVKKLKEELSEAKRRIELQDQESEEEVRKLTDMLMNLESKVREKEEEISNVKAVFNKCSQEFKNDNEIMKKKLKAAEEEAAARLAETSSKYKKLKCQFQEYHKFSEEQRERLRKENEQLDNEIVSFKETLLQRTKDRIEEMKENIGGVLQNVVSVLKRYESKIEAIHPVRLKTEKVMKEVLNLSVRFS